MGVKLYRCGLNVFLSNIVSPNSGLNCPFGTLLSRKFKGRCDGLTNNFGFILLTNRIRSLLRREKQLSKCQILRSRSVMGCEPSSCSRPLRGILRCVKQSSISSAIPMAVFSFIFSFLLCEE